MSRCRDRGFLDRMELWSPGPSTFPAAHPALVAIARIFEDTDLVMLDEVRSDIKRHEKPDSKPSRFSDTRDIPDVESYIENAQKAVPHASNGTEIFGCLTDTRCLIAWRWVFNAILESQGTIRDYELLPWEQAKAKANEILNLGEAALEIYDSYGCDELISPEREGVSAGIEARLRILGSFETIYSRPSDNDRQTGRTPSCHTFKRAFNIFYHTRRKGIEARRNASRCREHNDVSIC